VLPDLVRENDNSMPFKCDIWQGSDSGQEFAPSVKFIGPWTMKSENGRELLSVKNSFKEQEPHAGTRLQGGFDD
jgi:hypothetical protein